MRTTMYYRQYPPSLTLRPYIECYWLLDAPADSNPGRERLPADGRVEIIFNLAGDSRRHRADESGQPTLMRHAYIMGMRSQGYLIEQTGLSRYVSIRFTTGGLAAFTHTPALELTDQVVGLDSLWGERSKNWKIAYLRPFRMPSEWPCWTARCGGGSIRRATTP